MNSHRGWLAPSRARGAGASIGAVLLLLALTAGVVAATATRTKDPVADHPLVGAWIAVNDLDPSATPSEVVIDSDGTATLFTDEGPYVGVWQATGAMTAQATLVSTVSSGVATFRVDVTVGDDGDTFDGSYTFESACACGDTTGELGPGSVSGTRIILDPMGEPVAPLPTPEPGPSPSLEASPSGAPAPSSAP